MEKENKEKQYAWIVLRENPPASIDLTNSLSHQWSIEDRWLQGFEWTVLTIKNNRPERIYIADSFLEAKKWIKKEGYNIAGQNDDPSEMLLEAIYTTTKKTVDELKLEKNIEKLIKKAEDGITPYEPSVNDYDKCLSNNGEMKGRIEAFCEVLKLLNLPVEEYEEEEEGPFECSECGNYVPREDDVCSQNCFNAMMR